MPSLAPLFIGVVWGLAAPRPATPRLVGAPRFSLAPPAGPTTLRLGPSLPATFTMPPVLRALPASSLPVLAPGPSELPASAWDSARAASEALGRTLAVPFEGHAAFYENIARYLFNAYPDETLDALAARTGPLTLGDLPPAPRWGDKLARDLAEPYTDAEVDAHLERLQAELAEAVAFMRTLSPRGGFTLTLMGGIPRGRFSARSDLDVILRTEDAEFFDRVMASPFGYLVKERFVILSPPPRNKRVRRALGPMVDIGDGAAAAGAGWLRGIYLQARGNMDLSTPEREIPLDKLEIMLELKKLSKKALKFPFGDDRRAQIEERMRQLSKRLENS